MGPQTRNIIDPLLDNFAIRTFRDMADGDYIMARMAYRAKLFPQFLTAGHQAVEKYIKCILLLNRVEARRMGHNLSTGLEKLRHIKAFSVELSKGAQEFLSYLDRHEKIRYFEYSYYIFGPMLIGLDRTVWEVRRYCHRLDYCLSTSDGREILMLQKELSQMAEAQQAPQKYRLLGGVLERIIDDSGHPARKTLLWKNHFFGTRTRKRINLLCHSYSANSPLFLHPEILQDVGKYVAIPPSVKQSYKDYLASLNAKPKNQV